ncbi:hypothetical protein tb265_46030 [Gemmatimonadetes bacterium T265]|nr:hypothetical protein tb265_46030 [Gemmatimonadetes bacterium T265]
MSTVPSAAPFESHRPDPHRSDATAAVLLAGPALLLLVLVLHHPVLPSGPAGGRPTEGVAAGIVRLGPALGVVHGALLALLAVQTLGYARFSARLGWHRLSVTAGFLAYVAGAGLAAVPALLDGFVTPALAAACLRAAGAGAHECGASDGASLRLVAVVIQVFTKAGLLLLCAAAGAWGVALLRGAGDVLGAHAAERSSSTRRRAVGLLGLACAAVPAAVLAGADVWLRPGNLAALLAAQSVWACAAATLLAARPAS